LNSENSFRKDHEPPVVTAKKDWRYHHMGIPTDVKRPGEKYIPHLKMYVSGFPTSPYGIEWMRFEPDSPISELIQKVPHIAFEVDNIDEAIKGLEVLTEPNSPSDGVRVAMILDDGAPIELIEFPGKK
jgi:hypothetical protein